MEFHDLIAQYHEQVLILAGKLQGAVEFAEHKNLDDTADDLALAMQQLRDAAETLETRTIAPLS